MLVVLAGAAVAEEDEDGEGEERCSFVRDRAKAKASLASRCFVTAKLKGMSPRRRVETLVTVIPFLYSLANLPGFFAQYIF